MKNKLLILLTFILASFSLAGQTKSEIVIPDFDDKYCDFVKKIESGEPNIDFKEFRESFIESEQFKVASSKQNDIISFKKEMNTSISKKKYDKVIKAATGLLSIDYTNMWAHKLLQQTYKILGDTLNMKKYHDIEFGLLNSIIKSGDGKTCGTAWKVIQIEEEYFILSMINAKLLSQSIDNSGGLCDRMEVERENSKRTYYFETSKIFEGYKKLGLN